MVCRESLALIDTSLDRELDPQTDLALMQHLDTCAGCRAAYDNEKSRRNLVRTELPYYRGPDDLAARMRNAVTNANSPPLASAPRSFRLRYAAVTALAVVMAIAAFMLGRLSMAPVLQAPIAQEVVACHVRSMMASHLVDVISTDRHTVKPWYSGKLNFSPPVVDLSSRGYKLTGGRMDYVDGHPVAALVYRYRKHIINVFIWPSDGQAMTDKTRVKETLQGYNVLHWNDQGMTWWAVSDSEDGGLEGLADDLSAPQK